MKETDSKDSLVITVYGLSKSEDYTCEISADEMETIRKIAAGGKYLRADDIRHPKHRFKARLKNSLKWFYSQLKDVRLVIRVIIGNLQRFGNWLATIVVCGCVLYALILGIELIITSGYELEVNDGYYMTNLTGQLLSDLASKKDRLVTIDAEGSKTGNLANADLSQIELYQNSLLKNLPIGFSTEDNNVEFSTEDNNVEFSTEDNNVEVLKRDLSLGYAALLEVYPKKSTKNPITGTDIDYAQNFAGVYRRAFTVDFWVCLPKGKENATIVLVTPDQITKGEVRSLEYSLIDRGTVQRIEDAMEREIITYEDKDNKSADDLRKAEWRAGWMELLRGRQPLARMNLYPEGVELIDFGVDSFATDSLPVEFYQNPKDFSTLKEAGILPAKLEIPEDTTQIVHHKTVFHVTAPNCTIRSQREVSYFGLLGVPPIFEFSTPIFIVVAVIFLLIPDMRIRLFGRPIWPGRRQQEVSLEGTEASRESENSEDSTL